MVEATRYLCTQMIMAICVPDSLLALASSEDIWVIGWLPTIICTVCTKLIWWQFCQNPCKNALSSCLSLVVPSEWMRHICVYQSVYCLEKKRTQVHSNSVKPFPNNLYTTQFQLLAVLANHHFTQDSHASLLLQMSLIESNSIILLSSCAHAS